VQGQSCIVVGGGAIAARKIRLLHAAEAIVTVFSSRIIPEIQEAVSARGGQCILGEVTEAALLDNPLLHDMISESVLVIAATDDTAVNAMVSALAQMHHVPVNVVDDPELSTCIFPSTLSRGPMTVAVSSGGQAPVLTRLLRARLDVLLPVSLNGLSDLVAAARDAVRSILPDTTTRRRFWDQVLQDYLLGLDDSTLPVSVEQLLERASAHPLQPGHAHHIELKSTNMDDLCLRDLRHLQLADVLLFTAGVPAVILSLSRRDAEPVQCEDDTDLQARAAEQLEMGMHVVTVRYRAGEITCNV
jgi:uroporphyrin-III C-methyltransferase/precorrin-2 dehydrogenase/sirohydrochlorin ferrochelatase